MTIPFKNIIYDLIHKHNSLIDTDLFKILLKNDYAITQFQFNKTLLDLEILGLIKVSWLTKQSKRIEILTKPDDTDEVELHNKETLEDDYEASFPGA